MSANDKLSFDKFFHEANDYITSLSAELGHPDEKERTLRLWKAVMHTVRDRITMAENFNLMAQLPMILKAIYAEDWKYTDKPPLRYDSIEEMTEIVEREQARYGEADFHWDQSTAELITAIMNSLKRYVSNGELEDIKAQFPEEVKSLVAV